MTEHCETCRFHEPQGIGRNSQNEEVAVGTCMRFPPQALVNGSFSVPTVGSKTFWCGEYTISPATIEKRTTPARRKGAKS